VEVVSAALAGGFGFVGVTFFSVDAVNPGCINVHAFLTRVLIIET
jgi:hypothetical protein